MNINNKKDKAIGSIIGCAIGDALGAPVEFKARGSFEPVNGYRSGGKFNLPAGAYTDDTAMMLCLAQSLIDKNGFDAHDQLQKYCDWLNSGYLSATGKSVGCGKHTYRALLNYMHKKETICTVGNNRSAGNGSLMRIAPIAIYYMENLNKALEYASLSSYTTHKLKVCADACIAFTWLLFGFYKGFSKEDILSKEYANYYLFEYSPSYEYEPEVIEVLQGSYKNKTANEIESSGYVIHSLKAALWAFYHSNNFKDGALKAVNLGFDSDTVAAIYGTIAGACYGFENIDKDLVSGLMHNEKIIDIAEKLYESIYK